MSELSHIKRPLALRIASVSVISLWCLIAAFPIFWIAVMSVKAPIDSFSQNPFDVMFGPETLARGKGLSVMDIIMGVGVLYGAYRVATQILSPKVREWTPAGYLAFGWAIGASVYGVVLAVILFGILPVLSDSLNSILGPLGIPVLGSTIEHYYAVWVETLFIRIS